MKKIHENTIKNIIKLERDKIMEEKSLIVLEKKINIKKVLILIAIIIILILLIIAIINIINIQNYKKSYEQKIKQLQLMKQEEVKIKEEIEKKKQEKLPKLTEIGKKNITNIYKAEQKRAFLTFDDGPSTVTPQILDVLKKEQIKATFFVLGSRVEAMPEIVKRIYEEGHFIANHGYSHVYSSIYESPEAVLNEYNKCNNAVRNAIGEQEYNSHLFRYPGGLAGGSYAEIKNKSKELLNQNNIVNVDWNCLNGDAETNTPTAEYELTRLKQTSKNKNSIVVLMHDAQAKKVTAETLPQIIQYLREQGYEFKSFYDVVK